MTDINKVMAEALVEQGYADDMRDNLIAIVYQVGDGGDTDWSFHPVIPFSDTLEGRRQADALEDWLFMNGFYSEFQNNLSMEPSLHKWRLDRIKWCFEQLAGASDD